MRLQLPDIIYRDKGKTGFVLGLGPSLRKHLHLLKQIDQDKEHYKIVSCNNMDRLTDINFDYWMLAQPADQGSAFNIENAYNRYLSRPKAILLYTDCLDLTPRPQVDRLLANIDYIGYDQRHFGGRPCTWSDGPSGRHMCCQHLIAERLCIQEVLQQVTKYERHYSPGDTVSVHMLALAVITGMNPIYITGIDLDYTDGYVKNDLPETAERVAMGMSSINNSPDMVEDIIKDLTLIRDMAKNIGVEIYCLDEGLKISEIFPVKKNLRYYSGKVEVDSATGPTVNIAAETQLVNPQHEYPATRLTPGSDIPPVPPVPNSKPNDEYDWTGYTNEYAAQLKEIQEKDGQDFFIKNVEEGVSPKSAFPEEGVIAGPMEITFKDNLHPNWKELYTQVYKFFPESVFEVGFGGGYHLKNIRQILPKAEISGCDLLQSQLDFLKEFSPLPEDILKNLEILDFTADFEIKRQYDFVFSQAVVMHQSTEHAKAMLRNMGRISSKYIVLVEGLKNHADWPGLLAECLPDFEYKRLSKYVDDNTFAVLLTRKGLSAKIRNNEAMTMDSELREDLSFKKDASPDKALKVSKLPALRKYEFDGELLSAFEIIDKINRVEMLPNYEFSLQLYGHEKALSDVTEASDEIQDTKKSQEEPKPEQTLEKIAEDKDIPGEPLSVFTEIIGCADVGRVALETFHKYHDHKVVIFTTDEDRANLGAIGDHKNNIFQIVSDDIVQKFKKGHEGTAEIFALVFTGFFPETSNIVHFDSDVVFKAECLSIVSNLFMQGYDVIGTRRCYVNNPANIPVKEGTPDTVSTYFFGMRRSVMPKGYSFPDIAKMFLGHNIGLDHEVFDFGDAVVFHALKHGAKIYFLSNIMFGGQDEYGSKASPYKANMHIDAGRYLVHFGGAGSGSVCYHEPAGKNESYGKWAVVRYGLFCKIFFNKDVPVDAGDTTYNEKGRWTGGNYDDNILEQILLALGEGNQEIKSK